MLDKPASYQIAVKASGHISHGRRAGAEGWKGAVKARAVPKKELTLLLSQ